MQAVPTDNTEQKDINEQDLPYLSGLNPEQKKAVLATEGPVLVLAGAGTGKTRVLTTRLAHILRTNRAWPSQVLAVTFTNKAAQEMKERVVSTLSEGMGDNQSISVDGWWLGTFHSLAARMLRKNADLVGLTSDFSIIDTDDQTRLVKQLMTDAGIDTKKWAPKAMAGQISAWKDKAKTPDKLSAGDGGEMAEGKLVMIYHQYQARLKILNACDFGDLLLHIITILKDPKNAHILADYQSRFRYIMVDEYQDTNVAQYLWLRLLAQSGAAEASGGANICCVGDDDQSIYGWRGAEVGNILRFEKDFPGAQVIRLEQNYRSTGHILSAASAVISNNVDRMGKTLWADSDPGEKVIIRGLWDGAAEARWVGEEVETLQHRGTDLRDMAVLVRAQSQTREFEERFIHLGLPYKIIGGKRFYEREEIRDALAYLRVVVQPSDDLALERIINKPKRGIGNATLQTLYAFARDKTISLYDSIITLCDSDELRPKVKQTLRTLIQDFERWREDLDHEPHPVIAAKILEESGYIAMWHADKSPQAPGRLDNLKELVSGLSDYETLREFLEHVALVLETQDSSAGEYITIMTLHAAKGLEFNNVFLPGWEEGLFPSQRTMDENGPKGLEEERRLAYVGITRARQKAHISFVANRLMYGKWMSAMPSRFIDELPQDDVSMTADTGLYGSGRSQHWDSSGTHAEKRIKERKVLSTSGEVLQTRDRVYHEKFGYGTIIHIDGNKLDIAFDNGGKKRVVDSFVKKV